MTTFATSALLYYFPFVYLLIFIVLFIIVIRLLLSITRFYQVKTALLSRELDKPGSSKTE